MFNPALTLQQFLILTTALFAFGAGYLLHAYLLPRLRQKRKAKLRYVQPHPYLARLKSRDESSYQSRQAAARTPDQA